MEDKNLEEPIPEGWELKDEGSKTSHYLCPVTGQHFSTYEDLMRYVNYEKENKLSIYAPDCKINKLKRKRRRNKPSYAARGNSGGQSSWPPPLNPGKESNGFEKTAYTMESNGLEKTADPMESNDTGRDTEAGEAGKSMEAGDLEASEAMKEQASEAIHSCLQGAEYNFSVDCRIAIFSGFFRIMHFPVWLILSLLWFRILT